MLLGSKIMITPRVRVEKCLEEGAEGHLKGR